jgi:hypothetical protein
MKSRQVTILASLGGGGDSIGYWLLQHYYPNLVLLVAFSNWGIENFFAVLQNE